MATNTLKTRIALKVDTTANWGTSTLVILKGEMALEITASGEYKIKIGDGVNAFKDLPYAMMTPSEISSLVGDGAIQSVSLASGTNNGTLKLTVDGKATDNIAVKGLGSAAYTNSSAYATAGHNHTKAQIGLGNVDNTADKDKTVKAAASASSVPWTGVTGKPDTYTPSAHKHGADTITSVNATVIQGTIPIANLPAGALERCVIVADDAARFKLTTANVQLGDTVKVTATNKMYFVINESKLNSEEGYTVYTAGTATSVPWSGVTGKPSTFTPSVHTHDDRYYTETEMDSKLAGKSNTGHNHDDRYYTESEINTKLAGKSDTTHTHNYAGSSSTGGAANSAVKLTNARNISITGGAVATAVSFDGTANVSLNVTALSSDKFVNGSNTLIFDCGNATS